MCAVVGCFLRRVATPPLNFQYSILLWQSLNPKTAVLREISDALGQKARANHNVDFNFGAQIGYNISNKLTNKEINYFTYALGIYHLMNKKSRIVGGIYQSNQEFVGHGNTTGIMLGYEIKVGDRWYLMGDWMSGYNDAAVAVIGGMYNASKRVQVCAGWQIPNPDTPKPMGLVLEVNLLGWDLY